MPKLSDTQLVILSTAAARDDHAVLPFAPSLGLKGGAAAATLRSLLQRELIAERPAGPGDVVCREDEGDRIALAITPAGLAAIGIEPGDEDDAGSVEGRADRDDAETAAAPSDTSVSADEATAAESEDGIDPATKAPQSDVAAVRPCGRGPSRRC